MINRVLIRIKVVQMLYSYLLTRSDFRILPAPESASRDTRYAHSAYIDLLLLIVELSGYSVTADGSIYTNPGQRLHDNRVARALATDDTLRTAILRGNSGIANLNGVLGNLSAKIQASAVYADYKKKGAKNTIADDVTLWVTILESIIANDTEVADAMRANPEFTNVGLQRAIEMMVETLKSYSETRLQLEKAKSDLVKSLDKAYQLYIAMLILIVEITDEQADRLEYNKNKYLVTSADRNPNTRLVDNALADYLRNDTALAELRKHYKLGDSVWHPTLRMRLLDRILDSYIYKQYIEAPSTDFAADTDFWREVLTKIVLPSDELAEELEDKSVYWNDDLEIMGTFVVKTLRRIARAGGEHIDLLPKYKDEEDEEFGPQLFGYAVDNRETYRSYIDRFIDNAHWDPERMAFMDIVIMIAAIAEIVKYPKIPVPVTVNEYVEIANHYSTEKSGAFVNGILFNVIKYLNEEGVINK